MAVKRGRFESWSRNGRVGSCRRNFGRASERFVNERLRRGERWGAGQLARRLSERRPATVVTAGTEPVTAGAGVTAHGAVSHALVPRLALSVPRSVLRHPSQFPVSRTFVPRHALSAPRPRTRLVSRRPSPGPRGERPSQQAGAPRATTPRHRPPAAFIPSRPRARPSALHRTTGSARSRSRPTQARASATATSTGQ
jgi:hypothetical protein